MKDFISFLLVGTFMLSLLGASLYGGNKRRCTLYGEMSEREVRFSGTAGCFVKTENGWRHTNELRTMEGEL